MSTGNKPAVTFHSKLTEFAAHEPCHVCVNQSRTAETLCKACSPLVS